MANNMLNNLFGGLTGGAGGGGTATTSPPGRSSLFDNADVITDFTDHLPPVPGGATITQEDQGAMLAGGDAAAAGGVPVPPVLTPPPPHQGGKGNGGVPPPVRADAYSGIGSILRKSGHTIYDPGNLEAELAIQRVVTPWDVTRCQTFKDFVVNVQQQCLGENMLLPCYIPQACTIQSTH
jgi:hypothetical protein